MGEYLSLLSFSEGGWGVVLLLATGVTISLALSCVPFGLCLGLISALMIRSNSALLRLTATAFSSVFRSLPELLTLFMVYHGLQIILEMISDHFNYEGHIAINAFVAGMFGLGLVFAAFSSEVWLGAFKIIDRGQYEAAQALSLPAFKTFTAVIFPQVLRNALPGLSNNWLTLLKDTSLVSTISLVDIMRQTKLAAVTTHQPLLFYSVACLLYLVLSALSGVVFQKLEKRARRSDREVTV